MPGDVPRLRSMAPALDQPLLPDSPPSPEVYVLNAVEEKTFLSYRPVTKAHAQEKDP